MSLFDEVALIWGDKEYVVPPDRVMGLVEVIEDNITIEEMTGQGIKRAKVAKAFSAALRYAGAKVSQEDVYASMFGADKLASTSHAVMGLLALMIPPAHLQPKQEPQKTAKKPTSRRAKPQ